MLVTRLNRRMLFSLLLISCHGVACATSGFNRFNSAPSVLRESQQKYAKDNGLDLVEYDLNHDQKPDVFKFYSGLESSSDPILHRKEVDLNHDGHIDVIQMFNDKHQIVTEQLDLDFDAFLT